MPGYPPDWETGNGVADFKALILKLESAEHHFIGRKTSWAGRPVGRTAVGRTAIDSMGFRR